MSKLSFRARALDPAKPMPIYLAEELPDLPEYSAINRAVPQMPSGMEKEEESEHHLQRAICTGLIIPTPEVFTCDQDFYDRSYPPNYKMPRQMIHMQPLGLEQDIPDYDMDSADEGWVNQQSRRLELTPMKFEQMMDRLEKSSGQTVVTLNEAKALLKQDDEVSIAVYDYWLTKRLNTQHPLILSVKTENRPGTSANNPYLAFRRRTEKMQTRKNRKNDETSYEKMLKLRRDLCRATTVLEMVKRREKTKREQLHLSIEIFEKRVQLRDFSGSLMAELSSTIKNSRPAFAPLYTNQYSHNPSASSTNPVGGLLPSNAASTSGYSSTSQYLNSSSLVVDPVNASSSGSRKEKRQYKKRKHKISRDKQYSLLQSSSPAAIESAIETEEEDLTSNPLGSEGEDDGQFAFRRNKNCNYHRPLLESYGNWPWESKSDNGLRDKKYRYTLTSIRHPRPRCIGFARRRLGRGGRVILDRASTNMDDFWSKLDYTIMESSSQKPAECLTTDPASKQIQSPKRTCPTIGNSGSFDYEDEEDENISWDSSYVSAFVKSYMPIKRPKCKWGRDSFHPKHKISDNNENNNGISNTNYCELTEGDMKRELINDAENSLTCTSSPASVDQTAPKYPKLLDTVRKTHDNVLTTYNLNDGSSGSSNSNSFKVSCNNLIEQSYNSINRIAPDVNSYVKSNDSKPNVISAEVVVKKEINDSADLNILDDENMNLARLSSYINASKNNAANHVTGGAVIKTEPEETSGLTINNNQLPKSQFTEAKDVLRNSSLMDVFPVNDNEISSLVELPNASPTISKRMSIPSEILSEIKRDWLHFRPKTPSPILDEDRVADGSIENGESTEVLPAVPFSVQTPISIEMQHLERAATPTSIFQENGYGTSSNLWENNSNDALFVTKPFTYADLEPDMQLLPSVFAANYLSKSPPCNNLDSGSPHLGMDLNLSGDSLNDMSFSLGEDDNENMLDNILQECQIDELKTLNQTTNFWNGILDDGGAGLLDCIEEKKLPNDVAKDEEEGENASAEVVLEDVKVGVNSTVNDKLNHINSRLGSSTFSTINGLKDENFFKKEELKEKLPEVNKIEPPDEIMASPPPPSTPSADSTQQPPAQQQANLMRQQGLLSMPEFSINKSLIQRTLRLDQIQQKNVLTPVVTQGVVTSRSPALTSMTTTNHAIFATPDLNGNGTMPQKIYIKQSNCNVGGVVGANQVPNNLSRQNAVITLANVLEQELKNDVTCDSLGNTMITSNGPNHSSAGVVAGGGGSGSGSGLVDAGGGSSSGNGNIISTDNMMTHQTPMIVTTAKPQQQQQQTQQIVWRQVSQGATGILSTDSNKILWTSRPAQKKQLNGPDVVDKLLLSRKLSQRKVQVVHQQQQQQQQQQHQQQQQQQQQQFQVLKTDDDNNITTILDGSNHTNQKTVPAGKVIKMSSYPVVVSELSVQQQQNSAAVAANHNYSLQPSSQPITMVSQHSSVSGSSGNKLILSMSNPSVNVTNSGNFTIATSSGDMQNKVHYKEIPNTNLKLNFVSTGTMQQGNIVVDGKNTINAQQINNQQLKTTQLHQQQLQKLKRDRILNIIGGETADNNKRVIYTSLLNLKSIQKNNLGQMQITPSMASYVGGKNQLQRIGNNQQIFTNMRTVPIPNQVVNTQTGSSVSASGTTTAMFTTTASPKTSNDISVKLNNNSNDMATTSSTINSGTPVTAATANSNSLSAGINLNTTNR